MGNVIYYACLASAIQRLSAGVDDDHRDIAGRHSLFSLAFSIANERATELSRRRLAYAGTYRFWPAVRQQLLNLVRDYPILLGWRYGSGIVLALISVACWAWYALRNARWLREKIDKHPMMAGQRRRH